VEDLILL